MPSDSQSKSSPLVYILPSARDIIFILLFWSLLAGPLSNKLLADADIGWQIRTGEWILANHAVPRLDIFSSTMHGHPWVAWEWAYDVLLGMVHRTMGLNGVVWLGALIIASTMTLLLSEMMRRGTGLPLALLLMLLAEFAAAIHLFARPHIISWLFNLVWLIALDCWERGNKSGPEGFLSATPKWLPWFFPVSMLLWVNLHGGWVFGLATLACYAIGGAIDATRQADVFARLQEQRTVRAMGWAFLWSAVATLINPRGIRLHQHVYHYLGDRYLMNKIDEFQSPDFHRWPERAFAAILVLGIVAFVSKRETLRWSHVLLMLLAIYSGLYASRNLPVASFILVLVIGPVLWAYLKPFAERPGASAILRRLAGRLVALSERLNVQESELRGRIWPAFAVLAGLALCLPVGAGGTPQLIHARFDPQHFPAAATDFLAGQQSTEPIFAPDSWGGYLIYRLYPRRAVVVDDRHDLYGSDRVRELLILMQGEPGWEEVLKKWQIRTVLLPENATLVGLLRELPQQWRVVYEDKIAVVMEKAGS